MMKSPSAVAVKVRWYELVGRELASYRAGDPKTLNLLNEISHVVLADFLARERAGDLRPPRIEPPRIELDRTSFQGEVLVMSATEDVVFTEEIGRALAGAYPQGRLALFRDGHRLLREPEYYRNLRQAFFAGGLGSAEFRRLYEDALQLNR